MRAAVSALLSIAVTMLAAEGRAEVGGEGQAEVKGPPRANEEVPDLLRVPANDPRKGPRLDYAQGLPKCPEEKRFRQEVAYWLDGKDHLAADSPDVVRVRFRWRRNAYVGTVTYTDAEGKSETLTVTKEGEEHCLLLARWVALKVAKRVPKKPPPEPCPTCPPCQACAACPPPTVCPACPLPAPPPNRGSWPMDLTIGVRAYGMMTSLLTADAGGGFGVGVDVLGEVLSVSGEVRVAMPGRADATEPVEGATSYYPVKFDLSQFTALIVPCARWHYLVGCGVFQAGYLAFKSTVDEGQIATWGLGPRLGFEVPFAQRFTVFGFGEALFAPQQSSLAFTLPRPTDPDGPVANTRWRQSVVAGFFGVGFSVRFK